MKFLPNELTVRKGDTVKWINKDLLDHDVTEEVGREWSSGVMKNEAIYKMAIEENTDYFCSLHVVMKGKVFVK
nr:plastocyanin/azurin family copper-binding protein [Roseivirga sp. E12]